MNDVTVLSIEIEKEELSLQLDSNLNFKSGWNDAPPSAQVLHQVQSHTN